MSLISNSFTIDPIKGQLTSDPNFDTFSCQVDTDESGTLVPAQPVVLVDAAGDQIPVEAISAVDDAIFGFIPANFKINEYEALDQVKIVRRGVMFMEASAAIARGADVEVVISGTKVATQSSGTTIGTALDKAAADGDLIRVLIEL
jgi:hypothetical protein